MTVLARSLALSVLLTGACATSASQADNDALCKAVMADLRGTGLRATPTQEQARVAGNRLDARVTQVAHPRLHDAVVRLHQHVHDVEVAWRKGDAAAAARAAARARGDAKTAAAECHTSVDVFVAD
jgi:hypothetical protein